MFFLLEGKAGRVPDLYPDIDSLWTYDDPNATRDRFLGVLHKLPSGSNESYRLVLLTQIARTFSLQAEFDKSHALLDDVEPASHGDALVRTRYLMERGRTLRSAGLAAESLPLFTEAFLAASGSRLDSLAVDAAHMLAIAETDADIKREWNLKALAIAEQSSDERARNWLGSLLNNIGWDFFEQKKFDLALEKFEKAVLFRETKGDWKTTAVANWCVARTLRAMNRLDEALEIQIGLREKFQARSQTDGFVAEELGEIYLAKNDSKTATPYFAEAYRELSKDTWLPRNEPQRLDRLKKLGSLDS